MKDVEEYPLRAPPKEKVFRVSFDDTTSVVVPGHTVLTFTVNGFRWFAAKPENRKGRKLPGHMGSDENAHGRKSRLP